MDPKLVRCAFLTAALLCLSSGIHVAAQSAPAPKAPPKAIAVDPAVEKAKNDEKLRSIGERWLGVAAINMNAIDNWLHFSKESKLKLRAVQRNFQIERAALYNSGIDAKTDPTFKTKFDEIVVHSSASVDEVLTKEQKAQLPQAVLVYMSLQVLEMPAGALEDIKLTTDQQAKFIALASEKNAGLRRLFGDKSEDAGKKREELLTKIHERAKSILNAEQQDAMKAWEKREADRKRPK